MGANPKRLYALPTGPGISIALLNPSGQLRSNINFFISSLTNVLIFLLSSCSCLSSPDVIAAAPTAPALICTILLNILTVFSGSVQLIKSLKFPNTFSAADPFVVLPLHTSIISCVFNCRPSVFLIPITSARISSTSYRQAWKRSTAPRCHCTGKSNSFLISPA